MYSVAFYLNDCHSRSSTGELKRPQPDNYEGNKAGSLQNVQDDSGLTVENLQEWHDEACLAVLNNQGWIY